MCPEVKSATGTSGANFHVPVIVDEAVPKPTDTEFAA